MEGPQSSTICRVCLSDGAAVPIFGTEDSPNPSIEVFYGFDPDVYFKLCQCVGEKVIEDVPGYPRYLCYLCYDSLNVACQFIEQCKISTETLLKRTQLTLAEEKRWDETLNCETMEHNQTYHNHIDVKDESIESAADLYLNCDSFFNDTKEELEIFEHESKDIGTIDHGNMVPSSSIKVEDHMGHKRIKSSPQVSENLKTKIKVKKKHKKSEKTSPQKKHDIPNTQHLCDDCGQIFPSKNKLLEHKTRIHSGEFQCALCPKTFSNKNGIIAHIRRKHTTERPFVCALCGKTYALKGCLTNHHRQAHKEKPQRLVVLRKPCKICGKQFGSTGNLKRHISTVHQGDRPEVCTVCGKTFAHKHHLNNHMNLHTGERPVKCPICNQGFPQGSQMKSHIKHNHRVSQLDEVTLEALSKLKYNYLKLMLP